MDRTGLAEAQAAIERGDFDQARALLEALLVAAPNDVNALNLRTVLALRERDYLRAGDVSAQAFAQHPNHPTLRANRVLSLRRLAGQQGEVGDHDAAAALLIEALGIDPADQESRAMLLGQAMRLAQSIGAPASLQTKVLPEKPPTISVITCSINATRRARFETSLNTHFAGLPVELIVLEDARSLAEAYNRGIARSTGDLLVFCHDDIEFARPDFAARLLDALSSYDVVGVAGCTQLTGPNALWSGPASGYCQIAHVGPTGEWLSSLYGLGPVRVEGVQALDGVFIACHRHVAETLRFDADRFDHFHLYDTDFSWRAFAAGYRVAVAQDLLLIHHSLGDFNETWQEHAARFMTKFPQLPRTPAHPARVLMQPNRRELLLPTLAWLADWQARATALSVSGHR
ncbi:MAG: glycosyltransferase [Ahniella sp.]|nr:glycosyltransferase [Ahniella sp.]